MSDNEHDPLVVFPDCYDERAEFETPAKGWLDGVVVQTGDGQRYSVSFIDPVRLQQDMEEYVKLGTPYFSEPGLIILAEVTTDAIHAAIKELWREGFFAHLKPLPASMAVAGATKRERI